MHTQDRLLPRRFAGDKHEARKQEIPRVECTRADREVSGKKSSSDAEAISAVNDCLSGLDKNDYSETLKVLEKRCGPSVLKQNYVEK